MAPHFAHGWRYPWPTGNAVGVMTASKSRSTWVTPLKSRREFGVTVPKASLASRHMLKDGQTLLAVNVHCLSFERWGTAGLADQLDDIKRIMQQHDGPILFAGDFNSWSERRYDLVLSIADELGLTEVDGFSAGRKTGGDPLLDLPLGGDEAPASGPAEQAPAPEPREEAPPPVWEPRHRRRLRACPRRSRVCPRRSRVCLRHSPA